MAWTSRIIGHEKVPAGQLMANPFNHRLHPANQRAVVSASIAELGFVKSIIVNKTTGHIVDGHERAWQALQTGEDALVDVEFVELSEEEELKALLLLDASSELAEVDRLKLQDLVNMANFDDLDLSAFAQEMLLTSGGTMKPAVDDDELPEKVASRCKPGQLWLLGEHRLLVGDAEVPENYNRLFHGHDDPLVMVTDPPYGVNYDPEWRAGCGLNNSDRMGKVSNDDKADWTEAWRLFRGDIAYVWHGGLHASEVEASLARVGFALRAQIVWVKPRLVISRGAYHWGHEPALVVARNMPTIEPDDAPEAEHCWYAVRKGAKAYWCGGRRQSTVWSIGFSGEVKTVHSTQKPVECMARAMANHGKPGQIVYDPFLGSGTSIIAAMRTKRRCFGMELDPVYADLIVSRWEAITNQKAICQEAVDVATRTEANVPSVKKAKRSKPKP